MNKTKTAEPKNTTTAASVPQAKRSDDAFKRQAVELWIKTGKPGPQIARELGVSYPCLKDWKRRYYGDAPPERDDPAQEIRALKAARARVREQRDILKKHAGHLPRTPEERDQRIQAMKAEHSRAQLCAAGDVTRSGSHAWEQAEPSPRAQADAALSAPIKAVHEAHRGREGSPRIQRELAARGQRPGQKRIARLMQAAGLGGRCPKRFGPRTTDSDHDQPIAPHRLAQAPAPSGPHRIWVSDLTYVAPREGWLYGAVILDLWSRRGVGWSAGPTLQACRVVAALRMALKHRPPPRGLLPHSDRGVPYASGEHRSLIVAAGLELSMSRAGNPYDNATMESFMATDKRACVGLAEEAGGYATRAEAQLDFLGYAEQ